MLAADTTQSQPNRKKSKKQKKKQRQQQAQMAAAGFDLNFESESDTAAAPLHEDIAGASAHVATDARSQAGQDSEENVLERMMQATTISKAAANREVISCLQPTTLCGCHRELTIGMQFHTARQQACIRPPTSGFVQCIAAAALCFQHFFLFIAWACHCRQSGTLGLLLPLLAELVFQLPFSVVMPVSHLV